MGSYLLDQEELQDMVGEGVSLTMPESSSDIDHEAEKDQEEQDITLSQPLVDFTPSKYITLLFTDLGVLTPAAVSDELIKLYQWRTWLFFD